MVHDEKTYIAVEGHIWEFACAVVVDDPGDFVCKSAKAEHVGNGLVIVVVNDVMVLWGRIGIIVIGVGIVGFDKAGHDGVRDGGRDTDAGLFRSGRANSLARSFHVAF